MPKGSIDLWKTSVGDSMLRPWAVRVWNRGTIFGCCWSATLKASMQNAASAWRAADSLAIRRFVRLGIEEAAPDHSTISRTRRLIEVDTHRTVFTWVQQS